MSRAVRAALSAGLFSRSPRLLIYLPERTLGDRMVVNHERLLALQLPDHECAWTQRDCQLYALATGFGQDPLDERELRYVLEGPGFLVSPTNAITLYYDDRWMRASGVDLAMSLHGEQRN